MIPNIVSVAPTEDRCERDAVAPLTGQSHVGQRDEPDDETADRCHERECDRHRREQAEGR
ncbi:hypothetical protein [Curtobacterium flaccumfaciens]|uniref:hypothetical protein n=1 Tax=Curtobacterium flaccumfaciens TaxID=2035 RepID=UPI0021FD66BF|nr:hypothetical protein [Curtobacterium flaccumfaciens]UWD77601.1 hypothetical protein NY058_09105 [Curtobacterium flaccumfaciens]